MHIDYISNPVPLLIIRNIFSKKDNKEIIKEVINNKKKFKHAYIGGGKKPDFRNNTVSYYDEVYKNSRNKSKLLTKLDELFKNEKIQEMLSSSPYPLHLFNQTNFHETQVSRYGDEGQKYNFHIDAFDNKERQLTFVYYFNEEPKKYNGGEIQFTSSPIYKGKPIDKNAKTITITPENNMGVFFGSHIPHTVLPTKSPKTFSKGRFSVNCWIGMK